MHSTASYEKEFRALVKNLGEKFSAMDWEDEKVYRAWCAQTYFYVRHTMTMITLAASRYGAKEPEKFLNTLHHLSEERGHDQLLINDLDEMGAKIADFEEMIETQLFYQNQYYMIQNESPEAHIGYALLLEAICAQFGPDVYKRVCKAHGKLAGSFLEVHVIADQDHAEEGFKQLASISPETANAIFRNVKQSSHLYSQMLQNISATKSVAKKSAA